MANGLFRISKEAMQSILIEQRLKNTKNLPLGESGRIDDNANEFIDKIYYEDHYAIFNKEKYFVNGCQTKMAANGERKSRCLS